MPHVIVEYSRNLEEDVAPVALLRGLHDAVVATKVFPLGGVRVRAAPRDHYIIADGNPTHAFVAVTLRMGRGRDEATRKRVADTLMAALDAATAHAFAQRGLSLSVEIQEIDEAGAARKNNLHERVGSAPRA